MPISFFRGLPLTLAFFTCLIAVEGQGASSGPTTAKYGELGSTSPVDIGLKGINDLQYTTDVVLGGKTITVIIDTGSTDIWVDLQSEEVQITNTTDLVVDDHYAIGEVKGNILFAELRLGPYVIPHQAFTNASNVTGMPPGIQGLMGMAFDTAETWFVMNKTWGEDAANELARGPMTSLIAQDPAAPGFFDLELGRTLANGSEVNGHLYIGQHLASREAVTQAPKLERVSDDHWTFAMDGMNINGQRFTGFNTSAVKKVPEGKVAAVLDSGFSMSAFPKELIDAIYGSIPGAVKYPSLIPGTENSGDNNWIVPCNASANISFVFAGQEFPIHPLDVVSIYNAPSLLTLEDIPLVANATICTNHFFAGDTGDSYDIILGMGFLRNVYASFNYGNYTPPGNAITGELPYVQMLSVTDRDAAWAEYLAYYEETVVEAGPLEVSPEAWVKMFAALDDDDDSGSGDSSTTTSPATAAQNLEVAGAVSDDSSSSSSSSSDNTKYGAIALGLLGANVAVGLAVLAVTLTLCVRGAKARREARYSPVRLPKDEERMMVQSELNARSSERYSD
ncbi:acid protease [Trametes polyzona]|nr:acid protease [Trametes polyzona]